MCAGVYKTNSSLYGFNWSHWLPCSPVVQTSASLCDTASLAMELTSLKLATPNPYKITQHLVPNGQGSPDFREDPLCIGFLEDQFTAIFLDSLEVVKLLSQHSIL